MNTCSSIANFSEGQSFKIGADGRIRYKTSKLTYRDILLDNLPLDDVLYCQNHQPVLRFNEKRVPRRPYIEKEGLNDCENCESCGNHIDPYETSIVFYSQANGLKSATCIECIDIYIWDNWSEPFDDGDCYCDSCTRRYSEYDYRSAIILLNHNDQP